ncbi:MAG TPA: hypothetical protein PLW34_00550 [Termitinemataceae bacterium]|jgi:hypothetical protein|nr:hypothetical protein [Termitinemataceae bacterium]HOM22281.1 hypothetical protein [Termitinemataceae bacterium]HPP99297.1 hypothetical protein [Termitinemataceae bacterium]
MRKLFFSILVVSLVFSSCANVPPSASKEEKSPGESVPVVVEKEQKVSAPKTVTVTVPLEKKVITRFANGSVDEYSVSEYDEKLQFLRNQKKFSASGSLLEQAEYAYNGNRLVSKTIKDGEGKILSVRNYGYDAKGQVVQEILLDGNGKQLSAFEYGYDGAGNKIRWKILDGNNSLVAETLYIYDGSVLRNAELRDGTGKKTGASFYEYTPEGALKSITYYNAGGAVTRIERFTYMNNQLVKEERTTAGGQILQIVSYEYGSHGEVLKKTVDDRQARSQQIFEYEYVYRQDQKVVK